MSLEHFRRYDLNLLLALVALLEERNVTAAAERLGITQSAASRALARLRRQFDDPILVRAGGGMVPTERADAMKGPLQAVLDDLGTLLAIGHDVDPRAIDREFRISSDDYPLVALPDGALDRLQHDAPGARVRVLPPSADDEVLLAGGELDLALHRGRVAAAGVVSEPLLVDDLVLVCRAGHPRVDRLHSAGALAQERHVVLTDRRGRPFRQVTPDGDDPTGPARTAVSVPSVLLALHLVDRSDRVAWLPAAAVRAAGAPSVRILSPSSLRADPVHTYASFHERFRCDPAHAWLRRRLHASFGTP